MGDTRLTIMFLGAGKRVTLLDAFRRAADAENVMLRIVSVERDETVPIATLAEVLLGPSFRAAHFGEFLTDVVREHGVDIVIPNMDAATVALSHAKDDLLSIGCFPVVSRPDLCLTMEDKAGADNWLRMHNIPIPPRGGFPRVLKPLLGYGTRGHYLVSSPEELKWLQKFKNVGDYFSQEFVAGDEYTVDAFVSRDGLVLGALSRKRIEVVAGEVNVSETSRHAGILDYASRILGFAGWEGPITLQFIDSDVGPICIEVNPRFGGGVTHSIHCGLDMPRWIIREHLGRAVQAVEDWPNGSIMTRFREDVFL